MVWLELSWQADCPRLIADSTAGESGAGSTLAQQLQHGLRQMALVGLEQQGFERVVEFQMATRPGDRSPADPGARADGTPQQSVAAG